MKIVSLNLESKEGEDSGSHTSGGRGWWVARAVFFLFSFPFWGVSGLVRKYEAGIRPRATESALGDTLPRLG